MRLVRARWCILYMLVYKLITVVLILQISTAPVERVSSVIKIVKPRLHNWISDQFVYDCLVTYIEKDIFDCIDNEIIIDCFWKPRRGHYEFVFVDVL